MPAQLSLSAAKITRLPDGDGDAQVVNEAAQIVVRGDVATISENKQRTELHGVSSIESPARGTWLVACSTGVYRVERVAGRCCGRARATR